MFVGLTSFWPECRIFQRLIGLPFEATGGHHILTDGLCPNALGCLDRDIIAQLGLNYAIISQEVNDIDKAEPVGASQQLDGGRLIQAYKRVILRLHRHGIAVFVVTIATMTGLGQGLGVPMREATRQRLDK